MKKKLLSLSLLMLSASAIKAMAPKGNVFVHNPRTNVVKAVLNSEMSNTQITMNIKTNEILKFVTFKQGHILQDEEPGYLKEKLSAVIAVQKFAETQ